MNRKHATVALALISFAAPTYVNAVHGAGLRNMNSTAGGQLAWLNQPVVPGMKTLPGLATVSPLGLISWADLLG